jgi:hypothetical protein
MPFRLLLLPSLLAFSLAVAACDDNGADGTNTDDVRGEIQDVVQAVRDDANNLADDIDSQLDEGDVQDVKDEVRQRWNDNCQQMSEEAANEDLSNEITDACGDLRKGLDENDDEAVKDARDRLRDIADKADQEIEDARTP